MLEDYRVFPEEYNKMIDLVEMVDLELIEKYKKVISMLPSSTINRLNEKKEFLVEGEDFRADFNSYGGMIELQTQRFRKYFRSDLYIYPYCNQELLEDDDFEIEIDPEFDDEKDKFFIFSLTISNTRNQAKTKINFELVDGKYQYVNTETKGVEFDYEVFVERRDKGFCLTSRKKVNGINVYEKEVPVNIDVLLLHGLDVDEIEDGFEDSFGEHKFDDEF